MQLSKKGKDRDIEGMIFGGFFMYSLPLHISDFNSIFENKMGV